MGGVKLKGLGTQLVDFGIERETLLVVENLYTYIIARLSEGFVVWCDDDNFVGWNNWHVRYVYNIVVGGFYRHLRDFICSEVQNHGRGRLTEPKRRDPSQTHNINFGSILFTAI